MPSSRPDWVRPLDDPRNEAILSAAFDLFVEKGFHGVTMLDVAREAKVSKETLYARFDSKEGLLFAQIAWGCGKTGDKGEEVLALAPSDPIGALTLYARMILTQLSRSEAMALYRVIVAESGRTPEIGRAFEEVGQIGGPEMRRELFALLRSRGIIEAKTNDFSALEEDFLGLVRGDVLHLIAVGMREALDPEEIEPRAERAVRLFLKAYAPAKAKAANAA